MCALWPGIKDGRPELSIFSGVDLIEGLVKDFKERLKQDVLDIETVAHIYDLVGATCDVAQEMQILMSSSRMTLPPR